MKAVKKVFLGGTCSTSTWRDELIPKLEIDYFNPVVDDWNSESRANEIRERQECDIVLYVLTPQMTGVYAIAEAVDDSNKRPEKTIFCYLQRHREEAFTRGQSASLEAVKNLIQANGATVLVSLTSVAWHINNWEKVQNARTQPGGVAASTSGESTTGVS
jgi:hypothetical protein